jgi:predicted acyl esterase
MQQYQTLRHRGGQAELTIGPWSHITAETAPVGGEAATGFRYDPLDPTPSVGGRISSYHGGSRDNTAVEARADVLTFSTAPLAGPVHVAGVPSVMPVLAPAREAGEGSIPDGDGTQARETSR